MFEGCTSLVDKLDISKLEIDLEKVIDINYSQNVSNISEIIEKYFEEYKMKNDKKSRFDTIAPLHELSKISYLIKGEDNKIRIFGENFVKKYKGKCIIIYQDKIYPLDDYFSLNEININDDNKSLEIILREFEDISDRSEMFLNCEKLSEFKQFNDYQELYRYIIKGEK